MFCAIITFPLFEDAGHPGTFGKFSVTVTELVFFRLSFFHKSLKTWTWIYLKKGFRTPINIVSFPVIVIKYLPEFFLVCAFQRVWLHQSHRQMELFCCLLTEQWPCILWVNVSH